MEETAIGLLQCNRVKIISDGSLGAETAGAIRSGKPVVRLFLIFVLGSFA